MSQFFGVFLNHPDAKMPTQANATDAGWDLYSVEDTTLLPNQRAIVDTGIVLDLSNFADPGILWEAQIRPRSGLAAKHGLTVVNSPGTVDLEYKGNIKVILLNTGIETVHLPKGSKIAQMVIKQVPIVILTQLKEMPKITNRGTNGFGSSGV